MEVNSVLNEEDEEEEELIEIGSYKVPIRIVRDPAEEILLLWAIQQPTLYKQNALVQQSSLHLDLESCGHRISIIQSPSSMSAPGVTGAVMWDSGVVLGKFLEHSVDSSSLILQSKKIVEIGSGCGLVGCIAALLGGQVILTDLFDRLKLLKKNVEANVGTWDTRGSATVTELTWGEDPDAELIKPPPDYVLASDVIYSEGAVTDLLVTLRQLCGSQTTIFLTGELRNDAVIEYFLELATEEFVIGRVDQTNWHPDYRSSRVMMLVLVKKS
ncbi:protein N-lysine methyltransferase METTL21A-like [Papaver somniferum]|uniref:protein N-lysine methyltransferase METTL21A-like n=1 Tax=Papaver somniferum TaxID=3469 RepID=UPI000E6FF469|nr:protein N-lysine methyltransferase METTL21A-like [Papaver somniferum]XP_026408293.1 protein N-lysine methyltransferase METTL21A-like [Papaver somniferum]XP_026408294.1 protein N-lysine methyltransferase METTL21A-like [Papaver somniferum]